jgi:hypothetical protein
MKLEFSMLIFEKFSNMKFYENPSSGSRLMRTDGRKDRHEWSLFVILRTRLKMRIIFTLTIVTTVYNQAKWFNVDSVAWQPVYLQTKPTPNLYIFEWHPVGYTQLPHLSTVSWVDKPNCTKRKRTRVVQTVDNSNMLISRNELIHSTELYTVHYNNVSTTDHNSLFRLFFTRIPIHYFISRSCLFKWVTTNPCEHMRGSWEDTNGANERCAVVRGKGGGGGSADLQLTNHHETLLMSSSIPQTIYSTS